MNQGVFVGREPEMQEISQIMDKAISGQGKACLLSGSPGIGKTALVDKACRTASDRGMAVIRGSASSEHSQPFLIFSNALSKYITQPLFEDQEHVGFAQLFAINPAGLLIAKASQEEDELDADIFAGMLTAVQSFVKDSFDSPGKEGTGLGRLEYGNMKIMIEHGKNMYLVAVLNAREHQDMALSLKSFLRDIEGKHGDLLENWTGSTSDVQPIQDMLVQKLQKKFLVRKDLEGIKIQAEQLRIAENVLELLQENSKSKPILLVLEDLQWADGNSMVVLRFLARNIVESRIMVLLTNRPHESNHIQPVIEDMKKDEQLVEIALGELGTEDAKALLDRLYNPNIIPREFLERLARQCRGNPFFIKELLAQMANEGALALHDGSYVLDRADYEVPKSIEEVLDKRLAALDTDAMTLVEYASCLGQNFPVNLIQGIQTLPDSAAALNKLQGAGIINRVNGSAEFSHALFQDVVYNNMAPRWKSMYHLQIGRVYEQNYKEQLDEVVFELARHYAMTREHQKAVEYSIKAAEKAEASYALKSAIELYRQAIVAIDRLGSSSKNRRKAEILERLADMLTFDEELELALETYMEAYNLVTEKKDKSRLRRKRSYAFINNAKIENAMKEADKAMSEAEPETEEYWLGLHRKSEVYLRMGHPLESLEAANESRDNLLGLGVDSRTIAKVHNTLGTGYWLSGEYDKSLENYYLARDLHMETGDERMISGSYHNISSVLCDMGKLEEAIEMQEKVLEIDKKLKSPRGIAGSLGNLGVYYQRMGKFQEAYEWTLKAADEFRKFGGKFGLVRCILNMGVMKAEMGNNQEAVDLYSEALAQMERIGDEQGSALAVYFIGGAYLELGELDKAREWLTRSLKLNQELGHEQRVLGAKETLSELMVEEERFAEAERIQRESLDKSRKMKDMEAILAFNCALARNLTEQGRFKEAGDTAKDSLRLSREHSMSLYEATSTYILGRVSAGLGDIEKAEEEFQSSSKIFQDISAFAQDAKVRFHWGLAIGDKKKVEKALNDFRSMGMMLWVQKAENSLEELK